MSSSTTICFDFGNTRLKCGVFKNNLIAEVIVLADDGSETLQQLINKYHPDLDQFHVVMEQILIWFSTSAEKGYNGSTGIANRP